MPDGSVITGSSVPRSIEDLLSRGYSVKSWEYLHEGWIAFAGNPVGFVGFGLLLFGASQALAFLPVFGQFLSVAIQIIMLAGIAIVTWGCLQQSRAAGFGDFFPDWHTMAQVVLCTLVGFLFILVGFLLVLPGIYLMVAYTFSYLLVVDRRLGVWQALEGSRRVVGKHWWRIFGLTLMVVLLFIVGSLIGTAFLGAPLGYFLLGTAFPHDINLDDFLPFFVQTGVQIKLGMLIGLTSGAMVGGGLGLVLSGCMLGAAYADIFGLASDRTEGA